MHCTAGFLQHFIFRILMKGMWRSAQGFYLQRKHFLLVLIAVRCSGLDAWCGTIKINLTQFCQRCLLLSVDSNETLYGGDPKFLSEINKLCETLIGQILDHLKTLGRDEVSHCWTPPPHHHHHYQRRYTLWLCQKSPTRSLLPI